MGKVLVLTAFLGCFASASWAQATLKVETAGDHLLWTHNLVSFTSDSPMVRLQRQKCALARYANCPLLTATELGSGFLLSDGSVLVTTLHTFKNYLQVRWQIDSSLIDMEIPLMISDDDGQIIFGPGADDHAHLTLTKAVADLLVAGDLPDFPDQDVAVIRLSRVLGPAQRPAPSPVRVGETVTANGFTLTSEVSPSLKQGVVLAKPKTSACSFAMTSWTSLNISSYDAGPGFSGAPVLNAKQEVVGMHEGVCPDPAGTYTYFIPIAKLLPLVN